MLSRAERNSARAALELHAPCQRCSARQQRAGRDGRLQPQPGRAECVAGTAVTTGAGWASSVHLRRQPRMRSGGVARATSPHPDPAGFQPQNTSGSKDCCRMCTARPQSLEQYQRLYQPEPPRLEARTGRARMSAVFATAGDLGRRPAGSGCGEVARATPPDLILGWSLNQVHRVSVSKHASKAHGQSCSRRSKTTARHSHQHRRWPLHRLHCTARLEPG